MKPLQISLAPQQLMQAINPWSFQSSGGQFGLFNISLGLTPHPELEARLLEEVGSYGRQIGRLGDALEVLVRRLPPDGLTPEEHDALAVLQGQLAAIRQVKRREGRR